MRKFQAVDIRAVRVLDGGFATELQRLGVNIDGPLWSARALAEAPDAVLAVHGAYLQAGADIVLTGSYQVSVLGFQAAGYAPEAAQKAAAAALVRAVALAVEARARAGRPAVLVAASLGPYGAALANGAEFHGNYGFATEREEFARLVQFHRERVEVLATTEADLLAFETVPSLLEARAIVEALAALSREGPGDATSSPGAWISFTCRDREHTAHGELLRDCAAMLDRVPQVRAVGVNCTAPGLIAPLLAELRAGTGKPLVAYPNSGEGWDAVHRCWTGEQDVAEFGELARTWYAAGAQVVGGCCRTGPIHVRTIAAAQAASAAAEGLDKHHAGQ